MVAHPGVILFSSYFRVGGHSTAITKDLELRTTLAVTPRLRDNRLTSKLQRLAGTSLSLQQARSKSRELQERIVLQNAIGGGFLCC
jgi:hypothetical protein